MKQVSMCYIITSDLYHLYPYAEQKLKTSQLVIHLNNMLYEKLLDETD